MSLADELPNMSGPAASVLRHVQRYLAGAMDEEAGELWLLAVGRAMRTKALPQALEEICALYLAATDPPERSEAP